VTIVLPFVREVGVERAAAAVIMGEDIISCPEISGSAIKQLPAYGVAKRFWKKPRTPSRKCPSASLHSTTIYHDATKRTPAISR
jgi:hypothetical protein